MHLKKDHIRNLFDILLPILTFGIYLGYTTGMLCILLIVIRLFFIEKYELSIFFMLFGTAFLGLSFMIFSIPIPGAAISLLFGLFFIRNRLFKLLILNKKQFLFLFLFIMVFFISYLYGPRTDYSNEKMISIIYMGVLSLIAFLLYSTSHNISNRDLAQILLLVGISYIVFGINYYSFSKPAYLFDFSFFRSSSSLLRKEEGASITYHLPALSALFGLTFWLSSIKILKKERVYIILYSITTLLIILMSGARQALIGFILIVILRILMESKKIGIKRYYFIFLFFISILFVFINVRSEYLDNVYKSDSVEDMVNRDYIRTFDLIANNSLWGVGLGGYYDENISRHKYPHNLILEIICESGFIGLLVCIILIWYYLRNKRKIIKYETNNNSYIFLLLTAFGVRAMISEDIGANIVVLTLILSIVNNKYLNSSPPYVTTK